MYISLRDRPARAGEAAPAKVAPVVVTLGFVSLLTDISSESVAAVLPVYLTTVVGLSTIAYGFVDGLYQGVSALVRVAAGWAADRGDHPKWVALVGYGMSAVARGFLLLATGFASITAVVVADRIGKGLRTAPRDAMIAAATESSQLGRAFGVHRTLDTVGAALGPLVAFGVLWLVPDGYLEVMVVSLAFSLLGLALLGLLVPDVRPRAQRSRPDRPAEPFRWREVADPRLRRLLLVAGGLGLLTIGDGFVYLALLDKAEFAVQWFPLLYVGTNVAYLLLAVPFGRLADRYGRARVLVLGHGALLGAYLCAAVPMAGTGLTLAVLGFLGAFYAATDGVIAAVAGRLVPPAVRASGIAAAQTVVVLARLVSTTVFGVLWFAVGPATGLLVVTGFLASAIVVGLGLARRLDEQADVA
jgi:MFS family permease